MWWLWDFFNITNAIAPHKCNWTIQLIEGVRSVWHNFYAQCLRMYFLCSKCRQPPAVPLVTTKVHLYVMFKTNMGRCKCHLISTARKSMLWILVNVPVLLRRPIRCHWEWDKRTERRVSDCLVILVCLFVATQNGCLRPPLRVRSLRYRSRRFSQMYYKNYFKFSDDINCSIQLDSYTDSDKA